MLESTSTLEATLPRIHRSSQLSHLPSVPHSQMHSHPGGGDRSCFVFCSAQVGTLLCWSLWFTRVWRFYLLRNGFCQHKEKHISMISLWPLATSLWPFLMQVSAYTSPNQHRPTIGYHLESSIIILLRFWPSRWLHPFPSNQPLDCKPNRGEVGTAWRIRRSSYCQRNVPPV